MRCKLVSLFFPSTVASILLPLSLFREFVASLLAPRACILLLFFSLVRLSLTRTNANAARRAGNQLEIRRRRPSDWTFANHVDNPTDSRLCSSLAAFRTPVFAAGYTRAARMRARERVSVHACTLFRSHALALISRPLSSSRSLSPRANRAHIAHVRRTNVYAY